MRAFLFHTFSNHFSSIADLVEDTIPMEDIDLITFERRRSGPGKFDGTGFAAFFSMIAFISVMTDWRRIFVVLFFAIVFGLGYLARKALLSVVFNKTNQEVSIYLNRYGRFYNKIVMPFTEFNIRFVTEKRKGSKRMVSRLYHKKLEIISAEETNGWEMETLEKLVTAINEIKSNNQQP